MGFITGADATSPELTAGGTGVVTAVTGNSITVAKTGNRFVAGKKLKVAKKENSLKNWTFSFWFKKVNTDTESVILSATTDKVFFGAGNVISVSLGGNVVQGVPLYRDTFEWSHVVIAVDTRKDSGPERVDIYVDN